MTTATRTTGTRELPGDPAGAALQALKGGPPTQFLDKLGERLAFERTGVRLYEALISKHEALGSFAGGPDRPVAMRLIP